MLLRDVGGFARSSFIDKRFVAGRSAPVRMSSASLLDVTFFFFFILCLSAAIRGPLTAYGCKITLVRFGSRL